VRVRDRWVEVEQIEMDLGICVDLVNLTARTIPMGQVKRGDMIVIGREGVRVIPLQRPRERDVFSFMESQVSAERPHGHIIGDIAKRLVQLRTGFRGGKAGSKVLLAGGPAIVHAGGREALAWLIDEEFIHVLFCGNALPAHDMEVDLYGTSLCELLIGSEPSAASKQRSGRESSRLELWRPASGGVPTSSWPVRYAMTARCPV